jgi:hypothetical protein
LATPTIETPPQELIATLVPAVPGSEREGKSILGGALSLCRQSIRALKYC